MTQLINYCQNIITFQGNIIFIYSSRFKWIEILWINEFDNDDLVTP